MNSRKIWSDGFTLRGRERCVGVRRERCSSYDGLVDDEDAAVGGAEIETVEQLEVAASR